jgi:uncharacterized protein (TIGR00725 family)
MKLAIVSSASESYPQKTNSTTENILRILDKNTVIMTGGSLGVPGLIIKQAKQLGFKTVAYSPDPDEVSHNNRYDNLSLDYFDEIHHIKGFTARSLQMIIDADAILLLNGRVGTLSEFTIALEEGKRVAVLTNTGGVADHLEYVLSVAQKEFPGQVFFSPDVQQVMNWITQKTT